MAQRLLGNLTRGLVFILSAPAGTGKTTLVQMLVQEFPCVVASISFTTRPPRSGEINGVHYYFLNQTDFEKRIANDEFIEYVQLYGHYYGTSRLWVEEQLSLGKHVILVIDTQGARQLKGKLKASLIFIDPPTIDELKKRLMSRQTETPVVIEQRLLWAEEELRAKGIYDYCVINDDLAIAYQSLRSILIAEEHRVR